MTGKGRKHAGGRPPLIEGQRMERVTVTLPPDLLNWAKQMGDGNVSEGLRRLLEELDQRLGAEAHARREREAVGDLHG